MGPHLVWVPCYMFFYCDLEADICVLLLAGFTGIGSHYFHCKIWHTETASFLIILMRLPEHYWKENPWKLRFVTKLSTASLALVLKRVSKYNAKWK